MRWRHYSCALIALLATVGLARADVSYYYALGAAYIGGDGTIAGSAVPTNGGDPSPGTGLNNLTNTATTGGHFYQGNAGDIINIPIYLVEKVDSGNVAPNTNTSIINRYFQTANQSAKYMGVTSLSFAIEQSAAAYSPSNNTFGTSQILGGPTSTLNKSAEGGQPNTAGFVFGKFFQYTFDTTNTIGALGGSKTSQLYTNINDPVASSGIAGTGFNGNNVQASTALNGAALNRMPQAGNRAATDNLGVITDATFVPNNAGNKFAGGTYGTGKILIGTVSMTVGAGVTQFRLGPSTNANMQGTAATTWDGSPNPSAGTTSLSSTSQSTLALSDVSFTTSNPTSLDRSYNASSPAGFHNTSSLYDTFTSINEFSQGNYNGTTGEVPLAGPHASPASNSYIPYYTGTDNQITTFFVGTEAPAVPEPSSMALCGLLTAFGAGYFVKRRRKALAEAAAQTPAIA